ncbi:hypothetical protein ACFL27_27040 [candidate division CSSED10-310 bacterium]|uniref:Outer membrane protein beta-barrel domain-containing protein n=1 Tax=candidate division CSSED10-310 bacterium TaxID=2855610 RepID=A0ABV6Z5Y7_UNCC1
MKNSCLWLTPFLAVLLTLCFSNPALALDNAFALKIGYQFFQSDEGWQEPDLLGDDSSYFNGRNYSLEWDVLPLDVFGLRFTLDYFRQDRIIEYSSQQHSILHND